MELRTTRPVDPVELAHPYLAALAAVTAHWSGFVAIHAGGFVLDGQAWILPAGKQSGKTSTLAQIHHSGLPVIADDVIVIDSGLRVLAGPRFVDLRPEVALRFGWGRPVGRLGLRDRWRLSIPDCEPSYPLGGFLFPEFGATGLTRMSAADAISILTGLVWLRMPGPAAQVLLEAAVNTRSHRWARPPDIDSLERSVGRLIGELVGS